MLNHSVEALIFFCKIYQVNMIIHKHCYFELFSLRIPHGHSSFTLRPIEVTTWYSLTNTATAIQEDKWLWGPFQLVMIQNEWAKMKFLLVEKIPETRTSYLNYFKSVILLRWWPFASIQYWSRFHFISITAAVITWSIDRNSDLNASFSWIKVVGFRR